MSSTVVPKSLLAGRYCLVHRLASGGMGQVWRAEDKVLGRQVAVKLLRSELAGDQAFLDRFRVEARRTAALSHPGIASVFDYGEIEEPDPTAYLVMELVEGAPLSAVLARRRRLDPERVLDVVAQAALALEAAHRAGVVHRDVKPSNLVIRPDGVVKVTDFGIARAIGELPRSEIGLVVGTAGYLSPEQVACRPATPAGDVLSGSSGSPASSGLASSNPGSSDDGAQAHTIHPEQDTGEWMPVSMLLTQAVLSRRRPLAVTAMLTVLAVLATVLTAATAQHVPTLTVPSVSGQPITTAGQLLAGAGFQVRERARPNRWVKAGIVLAQDPPAGTRLERGTPVTLTISTGPAAVTVDPADYLGQALDDVRDALIRLGLQVAVETGPASGEPGTVVGITPSGALRQGETVTITVASSPLESSASAVPSGDGSATSALDRGGKAGRKHRPGKHG